MVWLSTAPVARRKRLILPKALLLGLAAACTFELSDPVEQVSELVPDDAPPPDDTTNVPPPSPADASPPPAPTVVNPCMGAACPNSCTPESCVLKGANSACNANGNCELIACKVGFVDCDGKVENGCEEDFRTDEQDPQVVSHQLLDELDLPPEAGGDIWAHHPNYRINTPCTWQDINESTLTCDLADILLPKAGPADPSGSPGSGDLRAVFQAGWSSSGLQFRLKVLDDDWYSPAAAPSGATEAEQLHADPRLQDNLEIVFFGLPPEQAVSSGADNHQLYVSFDGRTANATSKDYDKLVQLTTVDTANGCRISELHLTPNFLSGLGGSGNGLVPEEGQVFTFELGLNDFDRPGETPGAGVAAWQHRVFHRNPTNNYWFESDGVGELVLRAPATGEHPTN